MLVDLFITLPKNTIEEEPIFNLSENLVRKEKYYFRNRNGSDRRSKVLNAVIIQGIGLIGTILFFVSFQFKNNKTLFRVQFVSYICYTVHLLLLGAITGGFSYILNTVRSFCLGSKNVFLRSRKMCVFICILQLLTLILTWSGWISILPVAANIASTVGGYTHNAKKIRIAGMFINSPLWIIYNIAVGSWAGILDEAVSELSMIVSIIHYGWKNLDQTD